MSVFLCSGLSLCVIKLFKRYFNEFVWDAVRGRGRRAAQQAAQAQSRLAPPTTMS